MAELKRNISPKCGRPCFLFFNTHLVSVLRNWEFSKIGPNKWAVLLVNLLVHVATKAVLPLFSPDTLQLRSGSSTWKWVS